MLVNLPTFVIVLLNIALCPAIQLGVAWWGQRLSQRWIDPSLPLYQTRSWEKGGRLYEAWFQIKSWKDRLPDGAKLMGSGFAKSSLAAKNADYFALFLRETCRGELVHWIALCLFPLFFIWNPAWAGVSVMIYALAANLPCIFAQRYNRLRFRRLLERFESSKYHAHSPQLINNITR